MKIERITLTLFFLCKDTCIGREGLECENVDRSFSITRTLYQQFQGSWKSPYWSLFLRLKIAHLHILLWNPWRVRWCGKSNKSKISYWHIYDCIISRCLVEGWWWVWRKFKTTHWDHELTVFTFIFSFGQRSKEMQVHFFLHYILNCKRFCIWLYK